MTLMTAEETSLSLRALPTAELIRRRGRATTLAADRTAPYLERIAAVLAASVIDQAVDGTTTDPHHATLSILHQERDDLDRLINTMENHR
jgi:hypothetical protein